MISKQEVETLIAEHSLAPHLRLLQKRLAEELTVMVHSRADFDSAVEASEILFGKSTSDALHKLDEDTFLAVFEGVPMLKLNNCVQLPVKLEAKAISKICCGSHKLNFIF